MKAKAIVWWLIILAAAMLAIGCGDKQPPKKLVYQVKQEVDREKIFYLSEAQRCLEELKKNNRDSHFFSAFLQFHLDAGELTYQSLGTTEDEVLELVDQSFQTAAKADLGDLRSLQFDGDYNVIVERIRQYARQDSVDLEYLGTTEAELSDLVITNKKAEGRRIVGQLREIFDKKEEGKYDIDSFVEKIRDLAENVGDSVEVFGTTEYEIDHWLSALSTSP